MTVIDLVVAGLIAIAIDGEVNCKEATLPAKPEQMRGYTVIALDPGWPQPEHVPKLWVRVDGLANPPGSCYESDRMTPASDCTSNPDEKWSLYPMARKRLKISQDLDLPITMVGGRRERAAGQCWAGTEPGEAACPNHPDPGACAQDVSWIPEFAKVAEATTGENGNVLNADLEERPRYHGQVAAISSDLRGRLQAGPPGLRWDWDWSHSTCSGGAKEYNQVFAREAAIMNIQSALDKIWLIDIEGVAPTTTIELKPTATLRFENYPSSVHYVKVDETKCLIPHFELHRMFVKAPTACRRVPYFTVDAAEACDDAWSDSDPICPPVIIGRGGSD